MANVNSSAREQVLDPIERSSEVLFGLIMVLTFTGSLRVSGFDHGDVYRMLIGALGCNLAWGIIDAVMYLLAVLSDRGHNLKLLREVQAAAPEAGRRLVRDAMSADLAAVLTESEIEAIRFRFTQLAPPLGYARLHASDYRAATGVFLLVFLSTFPVVLPFFFFRQVGLALRLSNFVAIVMLFFTGWTYGSYAGYRPLRVGLAMVLIGVVLVALTVALGG